jgi:hypothetical protein
MRRAKILATLAIASLCSAGTAPPSDFEFEWKGGFCSNRDTHRKDKLTLKRGQDGLVQARVVFTYYCLGGDYAPDVKYLADQVQLRVMRGCEMIAVDLQCKGELTLRLSKSIARGTPIVFGFDAKEPHLRSVAP